MELVAEPSATPCAMTAGRSESPAMLNVPARRSGIFLAFRRDRGPDGPGCHSIANQPSLPDAAGEAPLSESRGHRSFISTAARSIGIEF